MKTIKNRKKRILIRAYNNIGQTEIIEAAVNNKNCGLWLDGEKIFDETEFNVTDKYELAEKVKHPSVKLVENIIYARMINNSAEGW